MKQLLIQHQEIHLLVFLRHFFVTITPSINTPEPSSDFIILIISSISFEINKVNPFLALTAFFPLILLSNLFITFEVVLLTNRSKLSLATGIATSASAFST